MDKQITQLAQWAARSTSLVAFTGAGISTESGLPDFRGPGGIWSRRRPVVLSDFLASADARREYWRFYLDFFPDFTRVRPNPAHLALAELDRRGRLAAVITQNIDRLHHAAGHAPEKVIELHGRIDRTVCLSCAQDYPTDQIIRRVEAGESVPVCDHCGGWLKPATVSFGQDLPREALSRAVRLSAAADVFLTVGSSLTVHPAAALPGLALQNGARLVIINATDTPYDDAAHLVIHDSAGTVLSAMIQALDPPPSA